MEDKIERDYKKEYIDFFSDTRDFLAVLEVLGLENNSDEKYFISEKSIKEQAAMYEELMFGLQKSRYSSDQHRVYKKYNDILIRRKNYFKKTLSIITSALSGNTFIDLITNKSIDISMGKTLKKEIDLRNRITYLGESINKKRDIEINRIEQDINISNKTLLFFMRLEKHILKKMECKEKIEFAKKENEDLKKYKISFKKIKAKLSLHICSLNLKLINLTLDLLKKKMPKDISESIDRLMKRIDDSNTGVNAIMSKIKEDSIKIYDLELFRIAEERIIEDILEHKELTREKEECEREFEKSENPEIKSKIKHINRRIKKTIKFIEHVSLLSSYKKAEKDDATEFIPVSKVAKRYLESKNKEKFDKDYILSEMEKEKNKYYLLFQ